MIIDDYLEYTRVYKEKYGEKCIVLMQVGSFFELYSIKDDTNEDIYTIADICNIQVSKKNKTITEVSLSNALMAGFPLYTLKKFTNILLNHNYTIVLVEQITEPPNPERKITEILSPGTNINIVNKHTNYLIVLYFEYYDGLAIVGIAGIDLSTGNTFVYETGSSINDPEFTNDETYRILTTYNPSEIIILSDKKYDENIKTYLLKNLNLSKTLVHYKWDNFEYLKILLKISYQTEMLEKAFSSKKNIISIIDNLNLDKLNLGRMALCCILHFAWEHNVETIKKLNEPDILNNDKYLTIEYNSAVQLNVLPLYQNDRPLIDILNRCNTAFGVRIFRERLLKPIIDKEKLNKLYDDIEYLLNDEKFINVSKKLARILDIERIKRKILLNKMHPTDWRGFHISIENAIEILKNYYNIDVSSYEDMMTYYCSKIDLNETDKYNINDIKSNIFLKGVYEELDNLTKEFDEAYKIINDINEKINSLDIGDATACKIEYNDRDGYFLLMTKKRYENAKLKNEKLMKNFQTKSLVSSTNLKITNENIIMASNTMDEKQNEISKKVIIYYKDFLTSFIDKYSPLLDQLIKSITDIDISCCNAKNAYEYRYYRPKIIDNDSSFIKAKNIRHPIIEHIDTNVPYIGNDVFLSNSDKNGMLLYGINSAGKSSLMKSIGLNIIMAQSGMYVASCDMEFFPYKHIFTRISGMDNIYKGMSSFIVEMTELRNILNRCDKYSLVLGDEVCNGTEAVSALAIVASAINKLIEKQSSFIFATHLHELTKLNIIKEDINKIHIVHIHISVEDNKIIYERKLKEGQGSSTYGVEVCKSLQMPLDFMKNTEKIRKEIQGYTVFLVNPCISKYNKDLYMKECAICKGQAIDTHHIEYQMNSNNGYFQDFHQNIKYNLVPLCKECHIKEHNGEINIKGYKKTSDGVKIEVIEKEIKSEYQNKENQDLDINKIRKYIKKGRCDWYIRNTQTSVFKKCTNDMRIIDKIKSLTNKIIEIDDRLCNLLYDPSM